MKRIAHIITTASILAVIALAAYGCRSTRTIYVPSHTTDTLVQTKHSTDTIRERDSIIIERAGDTITIRQVRWRDRVHIVHDTVRSIHTDTIREVIRAPPESGSTSFFNNLKSAAILLAFLAAAILVIKYIIKKRIS